MNSTNKKAIEILKSKMTLEERKKLVNNIDMQILPFCIKLHSILYLTFIWIDSSEKPDYWYEIYLRFTKEELEHKIDIK